MYKGGHAYRFYKRRFNFARKICQIFINGASVILRVFFHISGAFSALLGLILLHNKLEQQPAQITILVGDENSLWYTISTYRAEDINHGKKNNSHGKSSDYVLNKSSFGSIESNRLSKKNRARAFNIWTPSQKQPRFQYSGEFINVIQ